MTSGINANGMPNDRNTWLKTRACDRSKCTPITIIAGTMVIAAQEDRDLAVDEALHHDLACQGADRGRRDPRSEQRDAEDDSTVGAHELIEATEDLGQIAADAGEAARVEHGGGR